MSTREISSGPLTNFVLNLFGSIKDLKDGDMKLFGPEYDTEMLLLMNNGCRKYKKSTPIFRRVSDISDRYSLITISGMLGNEKNEFFDFYYTYDDNGNYNSNLVVFIDYFKDIKTVDAPEEDENGIKDIVGNSNFFFALKQITEAFFMSFYNPATLTNGVFNSCISGTNFRYNSSLFAGIILTQFKPLTEDDTEGCGIQHDMLAGIISNNDLKIDEILSGIRLKETLNG